MGKISFEDLTPKFLNDNERVLDSAMARMAKDIERIGKSRVPRKSGNLFKNIKAERIAPLQHRVLADTEYAGYQEWGQRKDGSRVVNPKNYTSPSTGKHYLSEAAYVVIEQALNYLKQAVHSIMK